MSLSKSGIPYLTHVWNVAVGCKHNCPGCWARERWAPRMKCSLCRSYTPHLHLERFGDVTPKQKPKVIGLGFFADLRGEWNWKTTDGVYSDFALLVILTQTIYSCPQHTFLSLTHRPDRLPDIKYPDNWHWGVTVTCEADMWRVDELLKAGTPHPWVSVEPMYGPVDLTKQRFDIPRQSRVEWVVCGGQSGSNAVPMHPDWARAVRDQCVAAGVPFWFKQWGEWAPVDHGEGEGEESFIYYASHWTSLWDVRKGDILARPDRHDYVLSGKNDIALMEVEQDEVHLRRVGHSKAGKTLDGREWLQAPEPVATILQANGKGVMTND